MTFTTNNGNRIYIENPNPKETLLELYPTIKIKEDERSICNYRPSQHGLHEK